MASGTGGASGRNDLPPSTPDTHPLGACARRRQNASRGKSIADAKECEFNEPAFGSWDAIEAGSFSVATAHACFHVGE